MKKLAGWHVSHYLDDAKPEHLLIAYALEAGEITTYPQYYKHCMQYEPILYATEKKWQELTTQ